ncbi:MAG TPA: ABC transporter permease [Gemmataceae bacterium]|nr:ABC transporter permease [Gemmataceae bacterium]
MSSGTYVETAPSALTEDQASFARTIGLTGLMATILGTLILILNAAKARLGIEIGNNVAFAAIVVGLAMMFFHAARDTDPFVRRLYGYIGGIGLPLAGLILSLLPVIISAARSAPEDGSPKQIISLFFPFGWACFLAGLFFLMSYCRSETEEPHRRYGLMALGGLGAALAVVGLGGGLIASSFALTYGSVMALLGLGYLVAFVSQLGGADLGGYRPALAIGALGVLVFVVALARSMFPGSLPYFVPAGLVLMAFGLAYALTAVFLVSDWTIVVLIRRELMAYFASPIAYILLFISALVAWINYNQFVYILSASRLPVQEPIVLIFYLGNLFGVFMLVFQVPALTMRLLSEEKRTGTYEVLMCAPVSEAPVVLSKLLAALAFYMLIWAVWLVFLLDVRVEAGKPFEYRPLISFYLALAASGASFLAMGLFFSSLTRNQIVAAAMTFVGMVAWIVLFLIARDLPEESTRFVVLNHLSFVTLWADSLRGRLNLPDLVVQASIAVFFTFLTVKVLEARRWS